ncbi:MAG: flagellar protein export ATPase FliI [Gammaproteobacteria bacterium]|nr:flagellar protein export ATPase FliI [Gammaproteobacteria bacterium]
MTKTKSRQQDFLKRLKQRREGIELEDPVVEGRLVRMVGLTLEAVGCQSEIGASCDIVTPNGHHIEAEVVGFSDEKTFLMTMGENRGLVPNARVIPSGHTSHVKVGNGLLGRVIDGRGEPLDGKGPVKYDDEVSLVGKAINPLLREPIRKQLDVGVAAINALLSVGRGQRMGLFAGTGVGKSVLLGMMTKYTNADITVVGLIGERGREVKEFVQEILGDDGMSRAVVVAAPSDAPPLIRLHGAMLATSIAEHFRDQGKHVLLLMDSLSRFAQAQREIGLSISEPPATKGYPPSVFSKLPQLVERAGNGDAGQGSITAFYTVLTEGDDTNDPIADSARGILDGHIVLSRKLAEQGHFPAIDIEASVSRVMPSVVSAEQVQSMQAIKQLYSVYQQNRDLINIGAYQSGSDALIDLSIRLHADINKFLKQGMNESVDMTSSARQLQMLANEMSENKAILQT